MLFNSFEFLFLFLPVTLLVFYLLAVNTSHKAAILWLTGVSLFFYAWWNPVYAGLVVGSMLFNFVAGNYLSRHADRRVLILAVVSNLLLLGYFKYFNFFIGNLNAIFDVKIHGEQIVLPLAISFFTFQQIAYLVDVYKGLVEEHGLIRYALFVTFFPQLIAGPIVHHSEMLPQFSRKDTYRWQQSNLAVGISILFVGLFKKVIIADNLAGYSTPVFQAAEAGNAVSLLEAWGGALAYTFQIYFDFSGYSDMAIGLARLFGITLPLNFYAPYKAGSIIDFWRRWHMTLSRFLKDYLYIPLGGNRKGTVRRYMNVMVTMLLGGMWHGASWTFIAWGGLHGLYILVNHGWRALLAGRRRTKTGTTCTRIPAMILTFLSVVVAWVFFRADTFGGATEILAGMAGINGIVLDPIFSAYLPGGFTSVAYSKDSLGLFGSIEGVSWLLFAGFIVWALPATSELFALKGVQYHAGDTGFVRLRWRYTPTWAVVAAALAIISIMNLHDVSEFLYFNF